MEDNIKSTSDDINKKQLRGIDLVVKALSKSYPFIKGWNFYKKTYTSVIFITLTINIRELTEYVKGTLDPYWTEKHKTEPLSVYSLGTTISDIPVENDVRKLRDTIEEKGKTLYDSLPDELAVYNDMESVIDEGRYFFRVNLTVFDFKHIYE